MLCFKRKIFSTNFFLWVQVSSCNIQTESLYYLNPDRADTI